MSRFKIDRVALQLYTLTAQCQTLPDFVESVRRVREIGYRAVQVSGLGEAISYSEVRKVLDDAGLHICATHESSELILAEPEAIVERLNILGTKQTAYPFPRGIDFGSEDSVRGLVRGLAKAGEILARNGQTLSYHNHANEFVRFGAATALDYIYASTDAAHLKAELDTYWVQYGGGDIVGWIDKLAGRAPLLHLKDYLYTREAKPAYAEIGQGNLDWKRILAAADRAGTEWLIVEQDKCAGDPFDSIRMSFEYLQAELGD